MPRYRNKLVFEIARGMKVFLRLDVGLTRGEIPDPERQLQDAERRSKQQTRQIELLQRASNAKQNEKPSDRKHHPLRESFGADVGSRSNPLKIVHVSTQDTTGGAARAAQRLHRGLLRLGHDSSMFVAQKHSDDPSVRAFEPSVDAEASARRERRRESIQDNLARYEGSQPEIYRIGDSFNDDRSPFGVEPLEQLPLRRGEPARDLWFHRSPGFFERIPQHTPVVWTLHDMNSFTGGCHYDYGCGKHTESCGACPQLGSDKEEDLSRQSWLRKHEVYSGIGRDRLHVVGASRWLSDEARRSSLFEGFPVTTIPYSLDTQAFAPKGRAAARSSLDIPQNARVVLFLTDSLVTRRKGFALLANALNSVKDVPDLRLLSLGYNDPSLLKDPPIVESIPHQHFDFLDDDLLLSSVYSAADLFVIPSLQENLPQTALEAMSCGTPVVGFDVGGIPDLVRPGVTGELAAVGDSEALGKAISKMLRAPDKLAEMSVNCRRIILEEYNHDLQAGRYADLYRTMIGARAD